MKIYFFSSSQMVGQNEAQILSILSSLGAQVISNLSFSMNGVFREAVLRRTDETGENLFTRFDALVIEGSEINNEVRYFVASAISNKRPVLLLAPNGQRFDTSFSILKDDRSISSLVFLRNYSNLVLPRVIKAFVNRIEHVPTTAKPTIKFTLRITPAIDRYLTWKIKGTNLAKADFLRKVFWEEIILKDGEYKGE